MPFVPGYEFIFKNKLGIVFNFYLNEQKHIEYIVSDDKGKWKEKFIVIEKATENFYLEIDNKNNIHLVSFHSNGELYYSKFDNNAWTNDLILQYQIEEQKILYPTIKYVNGQIHIFYYLIHTKDNKKAFLLHLSFSNKNYKTNHIATAYYKTYINPFKVFLKDNEFFILYGSIVNDFDQIFVSQLNIEKEKCDDPICLTSSKDKKIYIDGLLDKNKKLHIIWSKYDEEHLVVQYLNLDTTDLGTMDEKSNVVSLSNRSSCSFPALSYYKDILWATWTETNKIVSTHSLNLGKDWSKSYTHEDTRKLDYKRYRYVSDFSSNEEHILCDFIFGSLYPNIQFLGFGGEPNDDIPPSE